MRAHSSTRLRPGFSLAELLIALLLTAIVGAAVTGLFVSQNRFFEQQEKEGFARGVSRSAMNIVMSELRMVDHDSGLVAASDSVIQLRVPYALGLVCDTVGAMVVSLFPADSFVTANAVYGGYAYRQANDVYAYRDGAGTPPTPSGLGSQCTNNGVALLQPSPYILTPSAPARVGTSVMLYQYVTYRFAASTLVPGRRGLYRQVTNGPTDELVAPFDTTARFRYFWGTESGASQASAPADLSRVNGIELVLDGLSERPDGDGSFRRVPMRTAVFFKNRRP
jgi:prepilin-type N-terminal cleavage/methylation domain-containing protein